MTKDISSGRNVALPSGIIQNCLKTNEILRKTAKENCQQGLRILCVSIMVPGLVTHLSGSSSGSSDDANDIDRNLTGC